MRLLKIFLGSFAVLASMKLIGLTVIGFFEESQITSLYVGASVRLVYALAIAILVFWHKRSIFRKIQPFRYPILGIISLGLFISLLSNNYSEDVSTAGGEGLYFAFLARILSVGFLEELMFRIFVFYLVVENIRTTRKQRTRMAVLITSLFFGLAHALNITNSPLEGVFNQIIIAIAAGIILQSFFVRFQNILLIIALHAAFNYLGSFESFFSSSDTHVEGEPSVIGLILFLMLVFVFSTSLMLLMVPSDPEVYQEEK